MKTIGYLMASALLVNLAALATPSATAASLGPISEETPPAICDPGAFMTGIRCSGGYCDNIRIYCATIPGARLGSASWTRWVSEEEGRRACPAGSFIAGLACRGSYCDALSLYCVRAHNVQAYGCGEIGTVSEEGGGRLDFRIITDASGQRVAARSMRCTGSYCDNKSFNVCEISVN